MPENYPYKIALSGTAELRKLACDALNTAMIAANATGAAKAADFDDCMKKHDEANKYVFSFLSNHNKILNKIVSLF